MMINTIFPIVIYDSTIESLNAYLIILQTELSMLLSRLDKVSSIANNNGEFKYCLRERFQDRQHKKVAMHQALFVLWLVRIKRYGGMVHIDA